MPVKERKPSTAFSTFATTLRKTREALGMSKTELAQYLDVSPNSVWNWENDWSYPRRDTVARIATTLGVSEQYLQTGADLVGNQAAHLERREALSVVIDAFRDQLAKDMRMPVSRVKVSVEFLSG